MHMIFGQLGNQNIYKYTLQKGNLKVDILNYGGIVHGIYYPDKNGVIRSLALQKATLEAYQTEGGYVGALIGRVGNRIEGGCFTLNGKSYDLPKNEGNNTLHGGKESFDRKIWNVLSEQDDQLVLFYESADGEEGFPGNLKTKVTYTIEEDGLHIDYEAVCDQDTIINLTSHAYFNLHGIEETTDGLLLSIDAEKITPVDEELIPHNTFASVEGSEFDFRTPRSFVGENVPPRGCFDENFVLNGSGLRTVATLLSQKTGIQMDVKTDQPGMQIYTGNPHGIALETQNFPNAIHCDKYPSPILKKGEIYKTTTIYQFKK